MMAPARSAKLCYPAGLTARGACLYIAEHPSEIQGAIRMACSIEGLVRFQSTWREIAEGMGLVSKRVRSSDPDYAAKVRERTLVSSLPDLRTAAERLESLITDTRHTQMLFRLTLVMGQWLPEQLKAFIRLLSMVQTICAITSTILGRTIFLT